MTCEIWFEAHISFISTLGEVEPIYFLKVVAYKKEKMNG